MALTGECVNASHTACIECGTELLIKVCVSAAGYYIGFFCRIAGLTAMRAAILATERRLKVL